MSDLTYLQSILKAEDGHEKLEMAMNRITPHQRRVVELYLYEQLTLKKAAERLACSIKYTKDTLIYALNNLKHQLLLV